VSVRRTDGPPDAWLAIVRWLVPAHRREEVVGDLVELWHLRATVGTRLRGLRFWLDAWSIARHTGRVPPTFTERTTTMELLLTDVKTALRGLRSSMGTTLLAFGILAVTIAAGTITFSVVDAIAIRPLPFAAPNELVSAGRVWKTSTTPGPVASQDYFNWLERTSSFSAIGAASFWSSLSFDIDGVHGTATSARVSTNLFDVLGVKAAHGRLFRQHDDEPGHDDVMVLSHTFWTQHFSGEPSVVGRRVSFGGHVREIVGILPAGVTFPISASAPAELYVPYIATADERSPASNGRAYGLYVVGRLRPGVTLATARADLEHASAAMIAAFPQAMEKDLPLVVSSLQDRVIGPAKQWLYLVLIAVGVVLVIACLNVANLFLARTAVRTREIATRLALGASRGRLARVQLMEGTMLALVSAAAGIGISFWGVSIAKASLPANLARTSGIAVDLRVLVVSSVVAVLCGLIFASAPAWWSSRHDLAASMRTGNAGSVGAGRLRSFKTFLIVEMTFVSVLLVASALLVTSFIRITTSDLGFDRRDVVAYSVSQSFRTIPETDRPAAIRTFMTDLLDHVRHAHGVRHAALILNGVPLSGNVVRYSIAVPHQSGEPAMITHDMITHEVTPDYFATMAIRLLRGRTFTDSDAAGTSLVAIINDVAARAIFGTEDAVGRTFTFRGPATVVGVAKSVRTGGPEIDLQPEMYVPVDQQTPLTRSSGLYGDLVVRLDKASAAEAAEVASVIRPLMDTPRPTTPKAVDDTFRRLTADRRFNAGVMAIFGAIAILIGAIGIYGTMAFLVAQRVREIGVRMALGASPTRVMRTVLRDASWCVLLGLVIGLAAARAVSSLFTSLVFGVTPTSPSIYIGVAALLVIVGIAAALVPARRAARLDPLVALRTE
jgi:predicted permease